MESYVGAVQTAHDALLLLEAARLGLVPRVTTRLKSHHKRHIQPGHVFIWNESEAQMRRWTDGRSWSASRVTGSFLTYKEMKGKDETSSKYKADGLIKQSFSIASTKGDRMHLISYTTTSSFTKARLLNRSPSQDPRFTNITIPKDLYPQATVLVARSKGSHIVTSPLSPTSPESPVDAPNPQCINTYTNTQGRAETAASSAAIQITIPRLELPQFSSSQCDRWRDDARALRYLDSMSFK